MKPDKNVLIIRLNRIEGQVRGIINMIENDKHCSEVLMQVAAAKSALNSLRAVILESYMQDCIKDAMDSGKNTEVIEELMQIVKKYVK